MNQFLQRTIPLGAKLESVELVVGEQVLNRTEPRGDVVQVVEMGSRVIDPNASTVTILFLLEKSDGNSSEKPSRLRP